MSLLKLDRVVWKEFCEIVSRGLARDCHQIEIVSAPDSPAIYGRWLPAISMTCDANAALLEIALPGFGYITFHPYELYADCSERGLEGICVFDYEGGWQIMLLRWPLDLASTELEGSRERWPRIETSGCRTPRPTRAP